MTSRMELPWEGEQAGPVAARIAARAAQRIAEGALPPGEVLTEAILAEGASASRTPAREAMLQLEAWGLVRLMPKKGALITTVSPAERRDLLDVRTTWEIRSVQVINEQPESRQTLVDALHAMITSQQAALDEGDQLGFASHDFAFHRRIIEAGQNGVVNTLMDQLGPRFARLTYMAIDGNLRAAAVFRDEHERLVEFIAAGDAAGFAAAVRAHVTAGHFPSSAW
ncbi:DNA-binding GntR family transcriptional regulator [Compostimonas suwonensis]|uniref:DNA-binding GntR family transcriptional regulator n=2 Tax=Compostimonas suwonensis TaxID=1048394 RepID=A0A2M9C0N7_9MICO|nr:DNA-binding GntR family transcriptional regulator [Compostimonas suwonensis]